MRNLLYNIKQNKILVFILIISFVVALVYAFYFKIEPVVDAKAYDRIAINIIDGFGFREDRTLDYAHDGAIVRAGPGYEYFLAGVYKLFGHHYEAVWFLQALLHTISAFLIFLTAGILFKEQGRKIGLIAAGIFAFSPDLIEISAMLMTETLYLFFTVLVIYLFIRACGSVDSKLLAAGAGFAAGIAVLTRPPILLFVPVFLFVYLYKRKYLSGGLFLLFLALAVSPWVARNYLIYHQFILTTWIAQYNLWVGNTLLSDGGQISGGFNVLVDYTDKYGFMDLKAKANQEFFSFLLIHPFVFIKLCFVRFIRYFSLIRPMGFWFYQAGIGRMLMVGASFLWIAFLFITGFSGLIAALREKKQIFYYLVILTLTSPLVLISTVVQSRYRFQIYPFLALFAGYMVVNFIKDRSFWKRRVFWIPTLFLFAVSIVDILFSLDKVMEKLKVLF